jgi:hypothetical protein
VALDIVGGMGLGIAFLCTNHAEMLAQTFLRIARRYSYVKTGFENNPAHIGDAGPGCESLLRMDRFCEVPRRPRS